MAVCQVGFVWRYQTRPQEIMYAKCFLRWHIPKFFAEFAVDIQIVTYYKIYYGSAYRAT